MERHGNGGGVLLLFREKILDSLKFSHVQGRKAKEKRVTLIEFGGNDRLDKSSYSAKGKVLFARLDILQGDKRIRNSFGDLCPKHKEMTKIFSGRVAQFCLFMKCTPHVCACIVVSHPNLLEKTITPLKSYIIDNESPAHCYNFLCQMSVCSNHKSKATSLLSIDSHDLLLGFEIKLL